MDNNRDVRRIAGVLLASELFAHGTDIAVIGAGRRFPDACAPALPPGSGQTVDLR